MTDLVLIARRRTQVDSRTHYPGCEREHTECLIQRMADEIERRDEWREEVLDKVTTVGYVLGQHDGESLVDAAKRVTAEIERLHADNQAAVQAYADEITEAKAEIERLREDNETLNEIIAIHGNEINRLRVDAERYVWIFSNCEVTYYKNDLPFATEAALDAAMKEKE